MSIKKRLMNERKKLLNERAVNRLNFVQEENIPTKDQVSSIKNNRTQFYSRVRVSYKIHSNLCS